MARIEITIIHSKHNYIRQLYNYYTVIQFAMYNINKVIQLYNIRNNTEFISV